ncbi:MAG: dihydrofolate reductase [Mycoplasmoidaceae bacterium]|nr:dihydrofolate reductase [Mycoplasmoidaceae bacterium]
MAKLTNHKTTLYPLETFTAFNDRPLPNRVNIVFTRNIRKAKKMPNALITHDKKDLVSTFGGKNEDLYIIGSTRYIIELFAKDVDYIIDFTTEEMGFTVQSIFDSINFADYDLLKKQDCDGYVTRYFVRAKQNFIGY